MGLWPGNEYEHGYQIHHQNDKDRVYFKYDLRMEYMVASVK